MNFEKLTEYMDSLPELYGVPAADCKITKDHRQVYRHCMGYSDYAGKVPVSDRDLYRLYSATKVITMTAVLQLMERGKLDLYDEVRKFLPEFTNLKVADYFDVEKLPVVWPTENDPCHLAHRTIRMIDLMSMSAGLSYDMEAEALKRVKKDSGNQAGTREVVGAIARMPLLYEPGTRWRYSLAHDVLAAVVEAVSGMRFGEYLKANIFEPLEIKDFYFSLDEAQKARLSAFYTVDTDRDVIVPAGEELAETFRVTSNYESGGAGLIGTVDAYSVFADALCNGGVGWNGKAILSGESIRLFSTNYVTGQLLADFKRGGKIGYGYGLGVRVLMDPSTSRSPLGEFGWDGAAGAYVLADPVNHISIFYAQHIMAFQKAYDEIHPKIRDLAYEAMGF